MSSTIPGINLDLTAPKNGLVGQLAEPEKQAGQDNMSLEELVSRAAWTSHELGVAYLERGQYNRARALLNSAAALQPNESSHLIKAGEALQSLGRYQSAVKRYQAAAKLLPYDATISSHLASLYAELGWNDEALDSYREAIRRDPGNPMLLGEGALYAFRAKRFELALDWIGNALRISPDDVSLKTTLGTIQEAAGRPLEASRTFKDILKSSPLHFQARLASGILSLKRNALDEAIEHFRIASDAQPESAEAHHFFAKALLGRQRFSEASNEARRAVTLAPDNAAHLVLAAEINRNNGNLDEALTYVQRAIELNPANAEAQTELGCTLQATGQVDEAVRAFRVAIELTPDSPTALKYLGVALAMQGQAREAIEILSGSPDDDLQSELASSYEAAGDFVTALKLFNQIIEREPERTDIAVKVAKLQERLDLLDQAEKSLQDAIWKAPHDPEAHFQLGSIYRRLGRLNHALNEYRAATRVDSRNAASQLALGETAYALKRPGEAWAAVQLALELAPDSHAAQAQYALLLSDRGQTERALHHYQKAIELDPTRVEYYTRAAVLCNQSGNVLQAQAYIDRARSIKSDNPEVNLLLGDALSSQNRLDEAFRHYDLAVTRAPSSAPARVRRGKTLAQMNRSSQAALDLEFALHENPDDPEVLVLLAQVYESEGRPEDALRLVKKATTIAPNNSRYWQDLGAVAYAAKDLVLARGAFEKAIEIEPDAVQAFTALGEICRAQKQLNDARMYYERASQMEPGNVKVLRELGMLLRECGEFDAAIEVLSRTTVLVRDDPQVWDELGAAEEAKGWHSEALSHYQLAGSLLPSSPIYQRHLGILLGAMGQPTPALQALDQALALDPTDAESHFERGELLARRGQLEDALRSYQRASALDTRNGAFIRSVAQTLERLERPEQATAVLEKFASENPANVDALTTLSIHLEKANRLGEAISAAQRAVEANPENKEGWRRLGSLFAKSGKADDAIRALDRALSIDPANASMQYQLGGLLEQNQQFDEAEHAYTVAAETEPANVSFQLALGVRLARNNKKEKAYATLSGAMDKNEGVENAEAQYEFGQLLSDQGERQRAQKFLASAASLDPRNESYQRALGKSLIETGRAQEAVDVLQKAIELDETADTHFMLGKAYLDSGNATGSLVAFRSAAALDAHNPYYHAAVAKALWQLAHEERQESGRERVKTQQAGNWLNDALASIRHALALAPTNAEFHGLSGLILSSLNRVDEAFATFRTALSLDDKLATVYRWRGIAMRSLGRFADALVDLLKAYDLDSQDTETQIEIGETYLDLAQPDPARKFFASALQQKPDRASLAARLAVAESQAGDMNKALGAIDKALRANDAPAEWYALRGEICESQQKFESALEAYRRALELAPDEPNYHHRVGKCYLMLARANAGLPYLAAAVERAPKNVAWVTELAQVYNDANRKTDALSLFRQALQLAPDDVSLYMACGYLLRSMGDSDEASQMFSKAIQLRPTMAKAHIELGQLFEERGNLQQAVIHAKQCLAHDPQNPSGHLLLARLELKQGNPKQALQAVEAAMRLDSTRAETFALQARILEGLGRKEEALAAYEQASNLQPEETQHLSRFVDLCTELNEMPRAQVILERIGAARPADPGAQYALAQMYELTGQIERALESYQKATRHGPDNATYHMALGNLFKRMKRFGEAIVEFRTAAQLDPHNPEAYRQQAATHALAIVTGAVKN